MTENKTNKIKNYIVIGLAGVLAVSVYFRFIHGKVGGSQDFSPSPPVAQLAVPQVNANIPIKPKRPRLTVGDHLPASIRDIFSPLNSSPGTESLPEENEEVRPDPPPPSFTLKGTIVGGRNPIAIIDGQFVRPGDWVGEYRVVKIGKKEVFLDSDYGQVVLEILKNE